MAEKGPPAPKIPPTPKATRSKITDQAKTIVQAKGREPFQRNLQSKTLQSKIPH